MWSVTIKRYYIIIDNITSHYIFHTSWAIYIVKANLSLLTSLTYFFPPSPPLPYSKPLFFSLFVWLCLLMFVYLFCSLDSTYKWNYTVFVFVITFSIIPSRSIHVVPNGKSFLFGWVIFYCIYTTSCISIHLSMGTYVSSISWLL